MMGIWKNLQFPKGLKLFSNQKGIFYLSQLIVEWKGDIPIWKEKENLGLFGSWGEAWDAFLIMLRRQGICKMREGDLLRWADSKFDKGLRVNEIYSSLIEQKLEMVHDCWFGILWKVDVPVKMIIFLWLVMNDKNLTWRNLQRKGWQGPGFCILCGANEEDNKHLFYFCPFVIETSQLLIECLKIQIPQFEGTKDCLQWWMQRGKSLWPIPILFHWHLWCGRNKKIFEGRCVNPADIANKIYIEWASISRMEKSTKDLSKRLIPFQFQYPVGYFDGASQNSLCGCGVWLRISTGCHYKLFWNGGFGTNMKAEIMALWGLMWWASFLGEEHIWIVGDSKVLIDHLNHNAIISLGTLSHWLRRIEILKTAFTGINSQHIYREKNTVADYLSKQGLKDASGKMNYQLFNAQGLQAEGSVPII